MERAAALAFDLTILRPQLIVGAPYGVAMNLAPVIGAYAAICSELGEPFGFPGGRLTYGRWSMRVCSLR